VRKSQWKKNRRRTDPATELQAAVKLSLYQSHWRDLGCPKDGVCSFFRQLGKTIQCSDATDCKKHLPAPKEKVDSVYYPRVKYLYRIESMIAVGCKFGPDDLDPATWTGLITISSERQKLLDKISERRKVEHQKGEDPIASGVDAEGKKKIADARTEMGIPPPGVSLFKTRSR
jgi:hypothetical protein